MVYLERIQDWDPGILVLALIASGHVTLDWGVSALACTFQIYKTDT